MHTGSHDLTYRYIYVLYQHQALHGSWPHCGPPLILLSSSCQVLKMTVDSNPHLSTP